jgi:hypothetical protein
MGPPRRASDSSAVLAVLLWLWAIAVLVGYLHQFRGLAAPLLKSMG